MRIAVNTRFLLSSGLEGIGRYTYEITKRMVENHPQIEFHFLFDRDYDERFIFGSNVIPHIVNPPARHPILWKIWYDYAVSRVLKSIDADCFFSPDNYCSLQSGCPTLMTTHDLAFEHFPDHIRADHLFYFRRYSRRFHERANKIACVSESTRVDVMERYGIDQYKTFVAYNSCSDNFMSYDEKSKEDIRLKIANGAEYFLFVGAIHPRKNVENIIRAFNIYKSKTGSKTKLVIIGRWAWKYKKTKQLISQSPYNEDIIHIEFVSNLPEIMASAKALIYVSLFEGFGIPILEAYSAEVPVITSNVSSMPEVAGNAAILVNPTDTSAIADGMQVIDTDAQIRKELIAKGRVRRSDFSWDRSAAIIMKELINMVD